MWRLSHEKRVGIIRCLIDGTPMRAAARINGVAVNTIASFLREIGPLADQYHHENVRGVRSWRIQLDEVWTYVGAKAKRARELKRKGLGDLWTWTALDPDTKLLVSYLCGPRNASTALAFMMDLKRRLDGVPHFTSDGLISYEEALYRVFGKDVPYTRIVFDKKTVISGYPDPAEAGTSLVERWNCTLRQQNARYQRKTLAFSKSLEQHLNHLALWMLSYNWVRKHGTLGTTPAVAAGLIKHRWSEAWIAELAELYHESARDVERRAAAARADRQRVH